MNPEHGSVRFNHEDNRWERWSEPNWLPWSGPGRIGEWHPITDPDDPDPTKDLYMQIKYVCQQYGYVSDSADDRIADLVFAMQEANEDE